jgi:hypothetical protein
MQRITTKNNLVPRLARLAAVGLTIMAGNLWAGSSAVEGIVKDANGRPLRGADVRIETKGGRSWNKVVQTDRKGHYIYSGLTAGVTYQVSLLVNGAVKASIKNVQTKAGSPTELNFDLKKDAASGAPATTKKGKHYVYIPAQTGTHTGGRWVEVDDDNSQAGTAGANNVQTLDGAALKRMQTDTGPKGLPPGP